MKEVIVTSVSEFVKQISELGASGYTFFRGHSSNLHVLLPGLLRQNDIGNRYYSDNCDKNFLTSFKSRAIPYLDKYPTSDIEWMFTAQHYGIPTRLLDWSLSPLIALFFAVEKSNITYDDDDDGPVVWCLNPIELNLLVMFLGARTDVPNLMENDNTLNNCLKEYYGLAVKREEVLYPLALSGPLNNARINAQKGLFTLFPLNARPLEKMERASEFLVKIKIHKDVVAEVKRDLYNLGIKSSSIYPELSSISLDIIFEYNN